MLRRLRASLLRLLATVRGAHEDGEIADELASHLQLHIDDNVRAGMSLEEARREAVLKLGGLEPMMERVRDRRRASWLDGLTQDVRFAFRGLRRSPGFAIAVIV